MSTITTPAPSEPAPFSFTTEHPELGCSNNIKIIESALEQRLGMCSSLSGAVARYLWSSTHHNSKVTRGNQRTFTEKEVREALEVYKFRITQELAKLPSFPQSTPHPTQHYEHQDPSQ